MSFYVDTRCKVALLSFGFIARHLLGRRLPSDRWNWSDESGVYERTREGYVLPSSQWQWADEQWTVETKPNITDKDGWQYAVDFPRFEFLSQTVREGRVFRLNCDC